MLRHHFLLVPRFVWDFEFLEVPISYFIEAEKKPCVETGLF
jgi:hypothetical protein